MVPAGSDESSAGVGGCVVAMAKRPTMDDERWGPKKKLLAEKQYVVALYARRIIFSRMNKKNTKRNK